MPNVGSLELLVLALMGLGLAGVVALLIWLLRRLSGGSQSRIQTLETRVRELEERRP